MKLERSELTKALIKGLKLDNNVFNYQTVDEEIENIQEKDYMSFFKAVMKEDTYGNGLKAIMQVAEDFKPTNKDALTEKAKRIISFTESFNSQISEESQAQGQDFIQMVHCVKIPDSYNKTLAVMDLIKPYYNAKEFIINIRRYQTSENTLIAVKDALEEYERRSDSLAMNYAQRKQIANPLKGLDMKRLSNQK